MMYEAVFLRNGEEIRTLYWNGSLQETINLARTIAVKCKADRFRIMRSPTAALKCARKPLPLTTGTDSRWRPRTSQLGGLRAYKGRHGKGPSRHHRRHSNANLIGFIAP